ERARAQARADAGDTREVAQRGQGTVLTVRAVHHRNDSVAAAEDAYDAGQAWPSDAAVMPGAIGADRQLDDLVADVFECEGDCCGGGEGDLVLAVLSFADHREP